MRIGDEIPAGQEEQYLTKREAAERIRVSKRTIEIYIQRGWLRTRYTVGGHIRIWEPSLWRDRPRSEES